jgi:hypothetical protein
VRSDARAMVDPHRRRRRWVTHLSIRRRRCWFRARHGLWLGSGRACAGLAAGGCETRSGFDLRLVSVVGLSRDAVSHDGGALGIRRRGRLAPEGVTSVRRPAACSRSAWGRCSRWRNAERGIVAVATPSAEGRGANRVFGHVIEATCGRPCRPSPVCDRAVVTGP